MPQTRQNAFRISEELVLLEDLPLPVVTHAAELEQGDSFPYHQHQRAQLVYASSGVMTVTTASASYVVPPQRAVWMPAGVEHRIYARSNVAMRSLYIKESYAATLSDEVCVLQITPLLRELIITAVITGPLYQSASPQSRLMSVILDQIAIQPVASLALPMPTDPRLLKIVQCWLENPADSRDLDDWSKKVGASARTLSRLFPAQTGMSFCGWRQQRRLLRSLELLASGCSVTMAASEVGYDNTSAFIAMFKRCLGTTPSRYLDS